MPTEIRARVLLRPDKDSAELLTCPADVSFRWKKKGARNNTTEDLMTGSEGVIEPGELSTGTYTLTIADPRFTRWDVSEIFVEESVGEVEILLTPRPGDRLVLVKLLTPDDQPVPAGFVKITGPRSSDLFYPCSDGYIYAMASPGKVDLEFESVDVDGQLHCPQTHGFPYFVPAGAEVRSIPLIYWPAVHIVVKPRMTNPGQDQVPLTGTSVTVESRSADGTVVTSRAKTLTAGNDEVWFDYCFEGQYKITISPPAVFQDLRLQPAPAPEPASGWRHLEPGTHRIAADFEPETQQALISVKTPQDAALDADLDLEIYGAGLRQKVVLDRVARLATATVPAGLALQVGLAQGAGPSIAGSPLAMSVPAQPLVAGPNTITLDYIPSITVMPRVLLSAHGDPAQPTTPSPAGVTARLQAAGADPVALGPTDATGRTSPVEVAPGRYQVLIDDPRFTLWSAADLDIGRADDGTVLDITLVPRDGRWPVLLCLTQQPTGAAVPGASVQLTVAGATTAFTSDAAGRIYAAAPAGDATINFAPLPLAGGGRLLPAIAASHRAIGSPGSLQEIPGTYWPAIQISITPTVRTPDGKTQPLAGTEVMVRYVGSAGIPDSAQSQGLDAGQRTASFEYMRPGTYVVTVTPPQDINGWPLQDSQPREVPPQSLTSGNSMAQAVEFTAVSQQTIEIEVKTPGNNRLATPLLLDISGGNTKISASVNGSTAGQAIVIPTGTDLKVGLASGAPPMLGDIPLMMTEQQIVAGKNIITLEYEHSITVDAVDEHDAPVSGAVIEVLNGDQAKIAQGVTNKRGRYVFGVPASGLYFLSPRNVDGEVERLERVRVQSPAHRKIVLRTGRGPGGNGAGDPGGGPAGGGGSARLARDSLTDLSAYPVLTEEISTTGVPAPASGGPSGGPGGGYGQTVDQVMRDVLGWRPGGDVAGFQAALTGAFSLREVEGHREWSWQQRGYAVQADMGAITGAQASIYARAKNALDQVQPLLAGLTTLDPAKYPPQDLEAIRTVVSAELQELVTELALPGGPRIQRVDELFRMLLGDSRGTFNLNPDLVQGQLGTLRERFALTVDNIDTVDEELIVTNFRIIVEQILSLQASWFSDRNLMSGVSSRTALGTLLIWLSRGLEAVCESVGDLNFVLDSVYVDAAQRQVIKLHFGDVEVTDLPVIPIDKASPETTTFKFRKHEAPMFLSDLLDWVTRVSQDEGPRIVQDAGVDGVFAFYPVLDKLRKLVYATREIARTGRNLPDGMRTPRVGRALQVLASQLDEAANLTRLVKRAPAPQVAFASVLDPATSKPIDLAGLSVLATIEVALVGSNFRPRAQAVLIAEDREDMAPMPSNSVTVNTPSSASAIFDNPATVSGGAGTTWQVALINHDETQSPSIEVLRVPR